MPSPIISRTGASNRQSLHVSGVEDVFADESGGLSRVVFTNFTIETWVRFDTLAGSQTFIGRDDNGSPGEGAGTQSLFHNQMKVRFRSSRTSGITSPSSAT